MDKIIGFSLTRLPEKAVPPPWLGTYSWIKVHNIEQAGWDICFWGHGDLNKFGTSHGFVVGYSGVEMKTISVVPLQNRGLVVSVTADDVTITNDALGMLPVFYGRRANIPFVSTCEECVILGLGGVTLDRARLVQYLIFQSYVGTRSLWKEIDKLYANSTLVVSATGDFMVRSQPPLQFRRIETIQAIPTIHGITRRTIRCYTDPLDDVYLPLSRGKDSGMLLVHMQRLKRIHARTYGTGRPYSRDEEIVIAKARCKNIGVEDHRIIDFVGETYQQYFQPQIEWGGVPLSCTQAYIFGANTIIGSEGTHWPLISGSCGDITAGGGTQRIWNLRTFRQAFHSDARDQQFKLACYCQSKEWRHEALEKCIAFDTDAKLIQSEMRSEWTELWNATEVGNQGVRIDLIRLRNRGSQYITYSWAAADLWGCYVAPFTDREYVTTMLSLPYKSRIKCRDQKLYAAERYPRIFPDGGVPRSAWDVRNTINNTTISEEALWPLVADGSKPAHPYFEQAGIRALYQKALSGDAHSFFLLHSLQPIAWAIDRGYVR